MTRKEVKLENCMNGGNYLVGSVDKDGSDQHLLHDTSVNCVGHVLMVSFLLLQQFNDSIEK